MSKPNLGTGGVLYAKDRQQLIWQAGGWIYARAELPLDAFIVDVGGGQDPHPSADVVVDRFIEDDAHRMGQKGFAHELRYITTNGTDEMQGTRKLDVVQGDMAHLPFRDKSVDFIIARHTLEHVPQLTEALAELSRVGKAGYIEVPTFSSEVLFPQGAIHCWTFTIEKGEWIAHDITKFESPFGRMMHDRFMNEVEFRDAWSKMYYHFHVVLFWQDEVKCTIGERYGQWQLTH